MVDELLGKKDAARDAYRKAADADPENFSVQATRRIRKLSYAVPDALSEAESRRLSKLPQITDDEIRLASKALAELETFPAEFFGENKD